MRKKILLQIFCLLAANNLSSQNLVLNPGFEDSLQCPSGSGAFVNYVAVWSKPSYGSSDYFYAGCPVAPTVELPHGGNAYAGIICYDPANYREYITGTLSTPMLPGSVYNVSFFVSLMDNCLNGITEVGAWFTGISPSYPNTLPILLNPQVESNTPLTIDSGWKEISGSFVAAGGEQYIIIGSFRPDSQLTFTAAPPPNSWYDVYYFIDDVSVIRDSTVGMAENGIASGIKIYPDPCDGNFTVRCPLPQDQSGRIEIFDVNGKKIHSQKLLLPNSMQEINLEDAEDGIYYCVLAAGSERAVKKLAIITK